MDLVGLDFEWVGFGGVGFEGVDLDLGVGFGWVGFWMCRILDGLDLGKLDLRGVDLGVGFGLDLVMCVHMCVGLWRVPMNLDLFTSSLGFCNMNGLNQDIP